MIKDFITQKKCTLLCSGPMSLNCVHAAMEISNDYDIPMILIASRRQIDSSHDGGGYVENFNTSSFSQYIKQSKHGKLLLARDHGGPWQSPSETEQKLSVKESMKSAKLAFEEDIASDFNFIHIDPSVPIKGEELTIDVILDRLFELYEHCYQFAQKTGKKIEFELGTEEQNGYSQDIEAFDYFLSKSFDFFKKNKLPPPSFVVAQTGTKVMEMQNIGKFQQEMLQDSVGPEHIKQVLDVCKRYSVMLKEHNTDYLPNEALSLRPKMGIHASNVAPEFGVAETKALITLLENEKMSEEKELFIQTALNSNKWKKWMLQNSQATDLDKALICGHYIFASSEVCSIKKKLERRLLQDKKQKLDSYLKQAVKDSMLRYVNLFNML